LSTRNSCDFDIKKSAWTSTLGAQNWDHQQRGLHSTQKEDWTLSTEHFKAELSSSQVCVNRRQAKRSVMGTSQSAFQPNRNNFMPLTSIWVPSNNAANVSVVVAAAK